MFWMICVISEEFILFYLLQV